MSYSVQFDFSTPEARDRFVGYMSDGGGEYQFFESEDDGDLEYDEESKDFYRVDHEDKTVGFDYHRSLNQKDTVVVKAITGPEDEED